MKALLVLSLFIAHCAAKNIPPTQIKDYVDENKQLMELIKNNLTGVGNFVVELNSKFNNYIQSPNLTGAIERNEKMLLKKYNLNQRVIKKCIDEKNSAIEALYLKLIHKKNNCKWVSKTVVKQIQKDISEMSEIGIFMINSIAKETEKCLKDYANDNDNCLKCLSENRKPMIDQVNIFTRNFANLIDNRIPELENSIGLVSICVSETKLFIKKSEKYITNDLEECIWKINN